MVRGRFQAQLGTPGQATSGRRFSIAYHNPHVKSMLQYGLVSPPMQVKLGHLPAQLARPRAPDVHEPALVGQHAAVARAQPVRLRPRGR